MVEKGGSSILSGMNRRRGTVGCQYTNKCVIDDMSSCTTPRCVYTIDCLICEEMFKMSGLDKRAVYVGTSTTQKDL